RLRVRAGARPLPADRQPPPEEADRRGPARPRAAREVGVLLDQPRGDGAGRRPRRPGGGSLMTTDTANDLREAVREHYAAAARAVDDGTETGCCGSGSCCAGDTASLGFGEAHYTTEQRGELPGKAALTSLGCGNPTAVAELREGETVLDLGSGGGIDVILSARRVGPTGIAYGVDMTDEMLALARQNAEEAGIRNAIFLRGEI